MNIVVRRQRGGFIARFDTDTQFGKLSKSREEAICNLLEANKKRLGIGKITWDTKDRWTYNYLHGKGNRSTKLMLTIDTGKLPKVNSVEEARTLLLKDLHQALPATLVSTLDRFFRIYYNKSTLGDLAKYSEKDLLKSNPFNPTVLRFGAKHMAQVKELLKFYNLSLRE